MKNILFDKLDNAVKELHRRGAGQMPLELGSDFSCSITCTGQEAHATDVRLSLAYSSGGGPETSHLIEDTVKFVIAERGIRDIIFERDFVAREAPDHKLDQKGMDGLIDEIMDFADEVLNDGGMRDQ